MYLSNVEPFKRLLATVGNARKQLEQETGKPVVTGENYLEESEAAKRKRLKGN